MNKTERLAILCMELRNERLALESIYSETIESSGQLWRNRQDAQGIVDRIVDLEDEIYDVEQAPDYSE